MYHPSIILLACTQWCQGQFAGASPSDQAGKAWQTGRQSSALHRLTFSFTCTLRGISEPPVDLPELQKTPTDMGRHRV